MLTKDLVDINVPRLQLDDSVGKALQLLSDFRLSHLPVVSDDIYIGLISEEDLLDALDDKMTIDSLQAHFVFASVPNHVHFLNAVSTSIQFETSIIPVLGINNEFEGAITATKLLNRLGNFAGAGEIGGLIVLEMERSEFSISEISRIVESNDCTILHLNTTTDPLTGILTVTLHTNKKEIDSVIATFERYDYNVVYSFGNEKQHEEINSNYNNLMSYLSI
jgi:acetoin utilization protein AcuB